MHADCSPGRDRRHPSRAGAAGHGCNTSSPMNRAMDRDPGKRSRVRRCSMSFLLLLLIGACACVLSLAAGCGAGSNGAKSSTEQGAATGRTEVVRWGVEEVLGPKSVKIGSSVGYCLGDPRPRYGDVEVKEVGRRAYITAHAGLAPELPKGSLCEGVDTGISKAISFKHNLVAMELFDGMTKPPALRWSPLRH